jgi:hypothetical protein
MHNYCSSKNSTAFLASYSLLDDIVFCCRAHIIIILYSLRFRCPANPWCHRYFWLRHNFLGRLPHRTCALFNLRKLTSDFCQSALCPRATNSTNHPVFSFVYCFARHDAGPMPPDLVLFPAAKMYLTSRLIRGSYTFI